VSNLPLQWVAGLAAPNASATPMVIVIGCSTVTDDERYRRFRFERRFATPFFGGRGGRDNLSAGSPSGIFGLSPRSGAKMRSGIGRVIENVPLLIGLLSTNQTANGVRAGNSTNFPIAHSDCASIRGRPVKNARRGWWGVAT
jgi:hypothetical protein